MKEEIKNPGTCKIYKVSIQYNFNIQYTISVLQHVLQTEIQVLEKQNKIE